MATFVNLDVRSLFSHIRDTYGLSSYMKVIG